MSRLVLGVQPVREAIRAEPERVDRVLLLHRTGTSSPTLQALARFAEDQHKRVEWVDDATLDRLSKGVAHQGAIAVAADLDVVDLATVLAGAPQTIIALDQISDPQNFGAIIRSAVAFGVDAIVWPEHASAPLTPATFRASAGAIEHAALCRVRKLPASLTDAKNAGMLVIGLAGDSSETIDQVDLRAPVVIVVGSEGSGIRRSVRSACDQIVKLPTRPPVFTLNASVAAAVALYEVSRQRASRPVP